MVYTTEVISQNFTGWISQSNVWRVGVEVHFWVGALFQVCRQQLSLRISFPLSPQGARIGHSCLLC